jgi:hypothetical protein
MWRIELYFFRDEQQFEQFKQQFKHKLKLKLTVVKIIITCLYYLNK